MIKAVLFDYGGVLSQGGVRGSFKQTIADHFGVSAEALGIDESMVKLGRGFISTEEFFREMNKTYGPDKQINEQEFLENEVQKALQKRSVLVYDFAQKLRQHNVMTGIVSNVQKVVADKLRKLGNYDGFKPIVLSYEVGTAKPDEDFYQIVINEAGVRASEIIFIDDKEECLETAKKFGMKTILAVSPHQIVDEIKNILKKENKLLL